MRLRGEAAVLKKKLLGRYKLCIRKRINLFINANLLCNLASQKEVDDYKHQVYVLENDHVKFKSIINGLEKDIIDIKKEISERDSTIEEKEKRIFQLKSKNQELEKFKFILDFKV